MRDCQMCGALDDQACDCVALALLSWWGSLTAEQRKATGIYIPNQRGLAEEDEQ